MRLTDRLLFQGKSYRTIRDLIESLARSGNAVVKRDAKAVAASIRRWTKKNPGQALSDDVIRNAVTGGWSGSEIRFQGRAFKSIRSLVEEWNRGQSETARIDARNVESNLRNWRRRNPSKELDDAAIKAALTPRGARNDIRYKGKSYSGPTALFRALDGIAEATFKSFFYNLSRWRKRNPDKSPSDAMIETFARRARGEVFNGRHLSSLRVVWEKAPPPKLSWSGAQKKIAKFEEQFGRKPSAEELIELSRFGDWLGASAGSSFFRRDDGRERTTRELYDLIDGERCDFSTFKNRLHKYRQRTKSVPTEDIVRGLAASWGVVDRVAGILYRWRHIATGRVYVGVTTETLAERTRGHVREASEGRVRKGGLHQAIRRYGRDAFEISVLGTYDSIEHLQDAEIAAIRRFDSMAPNGFNLDPGGKGVTARMLPLSFRGKKFKNLTALAAHYGIPVKRIQSRLRLGWSLDAAIDRTEKQISRRSNPYGLPDDVSIPRLARKHGVDPKLVYGRLEDGWSLTEALDSSIRTFRHARAKEIQVAGQNFRSTEAAARHFGVSPSAWRKRIALGWSLEQAAGLQPPPARGPRGKT